MNDEMSNYQSRVIELDYYITMEIIKGHKPHYDDHLKDKRTELVILRCCLFGFKSPYCRNHFFGDE